MVLWVYIVLLLVGGLIGFLKAKSKVSLTTSAIFAALLVLSAVPGMLDPAFANNLANILMAILLVVFAIRLSKTKKFMPSGLMLVLTIVVLALRNLKF
ncbi:MAG TPA: TMEM14 family protein [Verrucomicrobiae bacterium]|nr:TMEM14 family protein [Verrucomicrobiae bacterium]